MTTVAITDARDPRLEPLRALPERDDPERYVAEGEVVVSRLLASAWPVSMVVGTSARLRRLAPLVRPEVATFAAPAAVLSELVGFPFHRGVIACGPRPPLPAPDWQALARARAPVGVVAAVGLADPANLGSIIRTSRALSAALVLCDRRGADPLRRRAIRGAMGHVFTQPIAIVDDLPDQLARAQEARFCVIAATPHGDARPLARIEPPARFVLLVGNEGDGLPPALLASAALRVTIPMAHGVDSLGVAVSTGVLLHALLGER
ncbi:MAG: RNA methyltransferase [Nannocystaceae bacterium]